MPRIEKTMTRVRLPQAEGAPHSRSLSNYIETPQTPRPKLSLINPSNINQDEIDPRAQYGVTRQDVMRDRPEYDYTTNESRKADRKKILREMAMSSDPFERSLGQATLIRSTLEDEEKNLSSKPDFDEDDEYELNKLAKKINYAKNREKVLDEDYQRHIEEESNEAKYNQRHNGNLIIEYIQNILEHFGYADNKLTSKTQNLYSKFMKLYETYFKRKFGQNFLENKRLTDDEMLEATTHMLSRLDEAKIKGGLYTKKQKNKKRGTKRNRKSRHQHK
jgi:hypothetical protein